jgi:two-component system nitrogen regulation response regulator GlnG/two-component system response regulator HydG
MSSLTQQDMAENPSSSRRDEPPLEPPSARTQPGLEAEPATKSRTDCLALVILWSAREPERVGEVALVGEDVQWILGRAPGRSTQGDCCSQCTSISRPELPDPTERTLTFSRQRPPGLTDEHRPRACMGSLAGEAISRRQLAVESRGVTLHIRNIGRCPLLVNGQVVEEAEVQPGDTVCLRNQLLLYCTRRPLALPALKAYPAARVGTFGEPDQEGMVGESPLMWKLRDRLAAYARTGFHILVIGESGAGKELAAQAIHRLSSRAAKKLVADNIAAIPSSLAAALLFGNKRNFPNPGMEERVGLIGSAHGSTLFLDEIGDMPEDVQPIFLRVTERGGEYFRLGEEARLMRSDFRLVGATNRPEKMRYELKRRFQREIWVPGLNHRKEDIPLLIRHLLVSQAQANDIDVPRFLHNGQPSLHPLLVEQLIHHTYTTHVSEVSFLLGQAMAESDGDTIMPLGSGLSPELRPAPAPTPVPMAVPVSSPTPAPAPPELRRRPISRPLPTPQQAQQVLDEHAGDVTRSAAALGISRDQLNRMIRRERLQVRRPRRAPPGIGS